MVRLLKFAGSLVVYVWDRFCGGVLRLVGRTPPATCVVLYYHAVGAEQRQRFAAQMDCLLRHSRPVPAGHQATLEPGHHYAAVTFDDGFRSVVENALPELESRRIPATIFVPTGSLGRNPIWMMGSNAPAGKETVLSSAQLKKLNETKLMEIGSHSITHPNLVKLEPAQARVELAESKSTLETILGAPVALFSFPHGAHNERLIHQARDAGYQRVFTISPRRALVDADEFVTGRTLADPTDWLPEFSLKLLGAYRWLPAVSTLKARLLRRSRLTAALS